MKNYWTLERFLAVIWGFAAGLMMGYILFTGEISFLSFGFLVLIIAQNWNILHNQRRLLEE